MNKKDNITMLKDLTRQTILVTVGLPIIFLCQIYLHKSSTFWIISLIYTLIPIILIIKKSFNKSQNWKYSNHLRELLVGQIVYVTIIIFSMLLIIDLIGTAGTNDFGAFFFVVIVLFFNLITWCIYMASLTNSKSKLYNQALIDYQILKEDKHIENADIK
jgi:hypothetical protein